LWLNPFHPNGFETTNQNDEDLKSVPIRVIRGSSIMESHIGHKVGGKTRNPEFVPKGSEKTEECFHEVLGSSL